MSKTSFLKVLGVLAVAGAALAGTAFAQTTAPSQSETPAAAAQQVPEGGMPEYIFPETPERRMARIGTVEDPGLDPDPTKLWHRFGKTYRIEKYERRLAAYDRGPGLVRPIGMINFAYEIYQQNKDYVWIWIGVKEPTAAAETTDAPKAAPAPASQWAPEHIAFFKRIRSQFAELTPPDSKKTVRFVESSEGLPNGGSWRNALAIADMNRDGFLDLVAPPERGGRGSAVPVIFLGDGKGKWSAWEGVQWPQTLDYGSVAAADFNKDGHQDLAFGVHLNGVYVLLGDSKGKFTSVDEGLPRNYPTRKVATADVDKDGFTDLLVISEGPTAAATERGASKLLVLLNKKKGQLWEPLAVAALETKIGGDWLSAGDLNGDTYPDFVASSRYYGSWDIVYLSDGPKKWKSVASDGDTIPSMSYYFANASANFTSKKRRDAIISYVRYWPSIDAKLVAAPPVETTTNIDHVSIVDGVLQRRPIVRWSGVEGVMGLDAGDLDGDGNADVLYTRSNPREAGLLLGDGNGGFTRARIEGLPVRQNSSYDVRIADVNGDRRPDVILMYESGGATALAPRDGSIHVYLNQGAAGASE